MNGFGWVKAVRLVEGYEVGSMGRWWEGGKGGGGRGEGGMEDWWLKWVGLGWVSGGDLFVWENVCCWSWDVFSRGLDEFWRICMVG